MFATPLPPAPLPSLAPTASLPTTHPSASGPFSAESLIRNQQDFLHQDLNNRLLAQRDSAPAIALPPSPFVRSETHQHQHQHQHLHNHMHQHSYGGLGTPLVPPTPPLFDKIPKAFETGVFRPSIVPSYGAAFSSLLPPGPSGASLASSLQGAFQPKNLVTPGALLLPYRDRDNKSVGPPPPPPPGLPAPHKKQGKWCALHVKVAWEIYHRQQKLQSHRDGEGGGASGGGLGKGAGPEAKPLEPLLRPPSHLLPGHAPGGGPSMPPGSRPPDIGAPAPSSLLSSGMPPFPRPSPYPPPSLLNPLGFSGLGSSMFAPVRDIAPPHALHPGLSPSPHEWNRLHRTPSSFPSWPKSEAEREKEREKERERELRKEEERERERRSSVNHRLAGLEDSRHKDGGESSRPKSRSRSRSPLRNGRLDGHVKPELGGHYERRYEDKPLSLSAGGLKLKEEELPPAAPIIPPHILEREKMERERMDRERLERDRLERERLERDRMERDRLERDRLEKEKLLQSVVVAERAEREKLIQAEEQRHKLLQSGGYIGLSPFGPGVPGAPGLSMLDRRVGGLMGAPGASYPFLERPPVPTSMWSPFDKSAAELSQRLELERERAAVMSRLAAVPSHLAALEQERVKEHMAREQHERDLELRRQYLDRLPAFTADRLRMADPLALGGYFPRTLSPMFGHGGVPGIKSNSPGGGLPGAPPPLIPSSSSTAPAPTLLSSSSSARSHDNSPSSSSKVKGCSPPDSTSDLKDKREGSSTDPDTHSR
ncbi:autism susceptibility gene 2 protein [Aplysia californica]|uniref:Autism susceptibility gene 2 protein n=1 Tax=Aplysia californica TaxID=6500 RepID=A0ABM0K8Y8_APLCA|nr:autism susceptibility gene 2 protein [Aplysia californica]